MFRHFLLAILLVLPLVSAADNPNAQKETGGQPAEAVDSEENLNPESEESLLDSQKRQIDSHVQSAAQWVDSFFADTNYEAEVATTQLRLRPEFYYRDKQGSKVRARVSLRLMLPNLEDKVSLIAGSGADDTNSGDSVDDSVDEPILGLQFFGKVFRGWHTSVSAGLKFNAFAAYVGPRLSYDKAFKENSSWRFTQTIRWQTNNYWQINSRLDLNHVFNDRYFFRQTFDGRWRGEDADEEGYRTRVSTFLTHRLANAAGLQYEFTTIFHTRPDSHVDNYTLALRYRKQTRRDWFYYEIVPQVSFESEFDYEANPGIRLRVELFFGANKNLDYRMKEFEDTDEFRW